MVYVKNVRTKSLEATMSEVRHQSQIECAAMARSMGLDAYFPAENELFIDIDSEGQLQHLYKNLDVVQKTLDGADIIRKTPSPSGKPGHYHVVIRCGKPASLVERMLLQAVLGSDLTREVLSWCRFRQGNTSPIALFEKPRQKQPISTKVDEEIPF